MPMPAIHINKTEDTTRAKNMAESMAASIKMSTTMNRTTIKEDRLPLLGAEGILKKIPRLSAISP